MRIWIFNHYALPPGDPGGTRHFALAKRLNANGHDVTLVASSFDHATRRERFPRADSAHVQEIDGVRFLWVRSPSYQGNTVARLWNMWRFARAATANAKSRLPAPDLIVGSSPHLFGAAASERLARKLGVPFVLEVRDVWPASIVDLAGVSEKHPLIRYLALLERRLYQNARQIVILMPGAKEHVVSHGGTDDKITWVPNGVDLTLASNRGEPVTNVVPTFLYAGAHGAANGLDLVLEAARILREDQAAPAFKIRLMGDGPEKARLVQMARDARLDCIEFADPVPKSQVYAEMRKADACLMVLRPSPVFRWGVSPNKLFDYMSSAKPVLFAVSSPIDPVKEAGCGVSVEPSPQGIADGIRELARNSAAERARMGESGRRYVVANHDHDELARRFEAVLQKAVK